MVESRLLVKLAREAKGGRPCLGRGSDEQNSKKITGLLQLCPVQDLSKYPG